ncbi:MAG: ATP-grasp domain-containing protein, partial [Pseudobdellovibrio sp.]
MNIHEFQAKEVLRKFGVATLKGKVANTAEEAVAAAKEMGGSIWVVKAQIHAGGRGKGGGVKIAKSLDEVRELTQKMLGMTLVTHQTGPEGKVVHRVFIEQGCNIAKEYYVACLIDRATGRVAMMA